MSENKKNKEEIIKKGHDNVIYLGVQGIEFGVHEETGEQLFKMYVDNITLSKEQYDIVKGDIEETQSIKINL